ncbi:MAG: hypothetical protein AAF449_17440, partial [Myxococcota bacterium]
GELAGQPLECSAQRRPDGRFECVLASVDPSTIRQGPNQARVTVVDAGGRASVAQASLTVDYDCPTIVSLDVEPAAARPGDEITVTIETNEPLGIPPRVSRAGRNWGVPVELSSNRFELTYRVSDGDPASEADMFVVLTDRAGNTTTDCGADGRRSVAIDHVAPTVDPQRMRLLRGAPGEVTVITGDAGAVRDDVRVAAINVYQATTGTLLATLTPEADGRIPATSLGGATDGRVLVQAVDLLDRTSERVAIGETWSLSLGSARRPNAGVGSIARLTPPAPTGRGISDQTAEFGPNLLTADGVTANVSAQIGFEPAGRLPNDYESTIWIGGGYDPQNNAIVVFGGTQSNQNSTEYLDRTLILRWDEASGTYQSRQGPPYRRGESPSPRGIRKIAFNEDGCGVIFGGQGLREIDDNRFSDQVLSDAWQICFNGSDYEWRPIRPQTEIPTIRRGPIIYDEAFGRWVVVGGRTNGFASFAFDDVWFLEPGLTPEAWQWRELLPRPSNFPGRYNHLVYYDPQLEAVAFGLGFVTPFAQSDLWWVYQNGQLLQLGSVPSVIDFRQGFDYVYDRARKNLVLWGDADNDIDPQVWLLTGTATNATNGWRPLDLNTPVPRAWPTMVYDEAREATVAFGGQRFDGRFVPPDIYTIVTPPAFPYLLTRIDLGTARPKGIERLVFDIVADGSGDADGTGPGQEQASGARVLLWNRVALVWEEVATSTSSAMTVSLQSPDRFVNDDGTLAGLLPSPPGVPGSTTTGP